MRAEGLGGEFVQSYDDLAFYSVELIDGFMEDHTF